METSEFDTPTSPSANPLNRDSQGEKTEPGTGGDPNFEQDQIYTMVNRFVTDPSTVNEEALDRLFTLVTAVAGEKKAAEQLRRIRDVFDNTPSRTRIQRDTVAAFLQKKIQKEERQILTDIAVD